MRTLILAAALLQAAAAQAPPRNDEVLVVGPPAPAMWRVTQGAGVLWILPVPRALPRGLAWNRLRLEGVLEGARVLISPGASRIATAGRPPREGAREPDARLPRSVRDRFAGAVAALGEQEDRFAALAPAAAAARLRDDAWRVADLDPSEPGATVASLARRAGVRELGAGNDDVALDAATVPDAEQAGCVDAAADDAAWITTHAAQAARAWELGDVRAWLAQEPAPGVARCPDAAPASAARRRRDLDDVAAAARAALRAGGESVLLTSPELLLRSGGLLERLRAAGARIDAPEAAGR